MTVTSKLLRAGILLAGGIYQFTPIKRACLWHCRDSIRFLTERCGTGRRDAFLAAAEQGIFGLGCC